VALVTFTVTVQLPDAGMVAPESLSEFPPLAAVTVPPVQVVAGEALAVFTMPDGYVSVKAAPVIAVELGLVSVMTMGEETFISMTLSLNTLVAVGDAKAVNVAEAAVPGSAFALEIVPVLFIYVPAAVAVIGTTIEQLPDAAMVPFDKLSVPPPLSMVTVPPQVFVVGAAAVFCIFVGYVSVNAAPLIFVVLGLISVMVMFVATFIGMVPALKLLAAEGAGSAV
jgi:hypothetical protein